MGRGSSKAGGAGGGGFTTINKPGQRQLSPSTRETMSGKPFDAKDPSTWPVGTQVRYKAEDDYYSVDDVSFTVKDNNSYPGTVRAVYDDHIIVDIPIISDHMWFEAGDGDRIRAVEKPKKRGK